MKTNEFTYKVMDLNTAQLEIPRETYQRELSPDRVRRIVKAFDERIANEPKVSYRDGHYYVFDGQHTIAARKLRNDNQDLKVRCKVYFGMSDKDEALLFAQQTGASAKLSAGVKIRARIFGGDPEAIQFKDATEAVGLRLDYGQDKGKKRLPCISTAYTAFQKLGAERYMEMLQVILDAWNGAPDSFRRENVQGISAFVDLYHDEYDPKRLISRLKRYDPLHIYREGKASGLNLAGYKKYLNQVWLMYNGSSRKNALPQKY
jgi:hypothetical protein